MSIQSDPAVTGTPSGPGLSVSNGLSVPGSGVNQSGGTAQVQHHPNHHAHDPYASYATYPGVVPYGAPYSSSVTAMAPGQYYSHNGHPHHAHPSQPETHHEPTQHHSHHEQQNHHAPQHPIPEVNHQDQMHSSDHVQHSQAPYHSPPEHSPPDQSPSSPSLAPGTPNAGKRGPPLSVGSIEEQLPASKKRKGRANTLHVENGVDYRDDTDVGPAGGAKHWTDDEKSRLFTWMLSDDERWEAFGSKMNTIFREGSAQLYNSRKTFTALKSCYHRNLDVFKQIYAFEAFLAKASPHSTQTDPTNPPSPSSSTSNIGQREMQDIIDEPLPVSFSTPVQRQSFLERKLDAARSVNVPIGNLTIRVLDHWQEMGWYVLFKKRFRHDYRTGLPVPRHAPARHGEVNSSGDGEGDEDDGDHPGRAADGTANGTRSPHGTETVTEVQRRHLEPMDCLIPPPFPNQPLMSRGTSSANRSQRTPPPPPQPVQPYSPGPPPAQSSPHVPAYPYPPHGPVPFYAAPPVPGDFHLQQQFQQQMQVQAQTAQALTHLTNMTQTLLGTCNTLTELVRAQMEASKAQTELMRRREERDEAASHNTAASGTESQRAALATDMLANPRATEEVKKLAADYLKRLFS